MLGHRSDFMQKRLSSRCSKEVQQVGVCSVCMGLGQKCEAMVCRDHRGDMVVDQWIMRHYPACRNLFLNFVATLVFYCGEEMIIMAKRTVRQ